MALSIRSSVGPVLALLFATGLACGSSDGSPSNQPTSTDGGGGSGGGGSGTAGTNSTTGGPAGSSVGSGGSAGSSEGTGGSSVSAGGSAGTTSGPRDGGVAACNAEFTSALSKDCTTDADCSLADHNDCCGTISIAIHKGTDAAFSAAEKAYPICVPNCLGRGCFHATMAEDGNMVSMTSQAIFARCDNQKCKSVVANAPTCVASRDCAVGQICVTFASGLLAARHECRSNPCPTDMPTCTCASSICTGFGAGLCTANAFDITCNDGRK